MIYTIVHTVFRLYEVAVVLRVLFSWIHVNEFNPAVRWICRITDPLLDPIRRILPTGSLPIDFSPLVLLLLLSLAERLIVGLLF